MNKGVNKGVIRVFNSLSGQKEVFKPQKPPQVKIYVCGPTTYNLIHLGNARPLVVFDTVRRYLTYAGYEVIYVQNFTDVDDKIIQKAQKEGIAPEILAEKYIQEYFFDADALHVQRATSYPRVSENMETVLRFITGLLAKGYAYVVQGNVFFAVSQFADYGKLSKRTVADLQAGARIEVDERKRDPADFALWKEAKAGEPAWDSPWGKGRPGWHIECSAMAARFLGQSFDIHAGGLDLVFPHHENEIAQSEALHGVPMAQYWLHNGFITISQEKMSKSRGNFFLLREIFQKYDPVVVRFYLLSTHYRRPLDFTAEKLTEAEKGWSRLQTAHRLLKEKLLTAEAQKQKGGRADLPSAEIGAEFAPELSQLVPRFQEAMNDDFNTALALAILFDFAHVLNSLPSPAGVWFGEADQSLLEQALAQYEALAAVLGLPFAEEGAATGSPESMTREKELVDLLLQVRQDRREKRDYATADLIRDELQKLGIVLEDTPTGVRWWKQVGERGGQDG